MMRARRKSFEGIVDLWLGLFDEHNLLTYASAIAFQTFIAFIALTLLGLGLLGAIGDERPWTDTIGPASRTPEVLRNLTEIDEHGSRLSTVAAALGTTKQYAGKLARELESAGLIVLADDPADRRAVLAKPTARGRAFFEDACEVRAELEAEFLAGLTPSRAATFISLLEDLVGAPRRA